MVTAAVLSDGKKVDVTLSPDPANVLEGTGAFKAGKGTTIVVTLIMPDHKPEQIRIKLDRLVPEGGGLDLGSLPDAPWPDVIRPSSAPGKTRDVGRRWPCRARPCSVSGAGSV